jgi:hypothetical protein
MSTLQTLLTHFGLTALPFDRAVPLEGLLRHPSVGEAAERLRFALDIRAPALLVAAPGTGKSVLLETVCRELAPPDVRVVATALSSCGPFGLVGQLAARYGTPLRRTTAQTAAVLLDELARSPKTELFVLDERTGCPTPRSMSSASSASSSSIAAPLSSCSSPASPACATASRPPTSRPSGSGSPSGPHSARSPTARRPSTSSAAPARSAPAPRSSALARSIASSSTVAGSCAGSISWRPAPCSPRPARAASTSTTPMCRPPSSTMSTPDRPAPYLTLPAARVAETTSPVRWLLECRS